MSVVAVPLIVEVTPGPPSYAVGPTPPKKSFRFQINPGENIDPKDKFDAVVEVFAQANLVTKERKRGIVGMEILLDGKSMLKVDGIYDPDDFPADQLFSRTVTKSRTLTNLRGAHEVTVRPIHATEFSSTTVFHIRLKFHSVT